MRNLGGGCGLPWASVFQTADRAKVEAYCKRAEIELEWQPRDRLRTWQVRDAIVRHPHTGERVWFNHAAFFHLSTLDDETRQALQAEFVEDDLPNNTYYGDGSAIESDAMDAIRDAYRHETVTFDWEMGDVLLLDNILTAHGREPYSGARRILVAMAEPIDRRVLAIG
jgi:alpha-ketoglutarate-dependent taurine dioxygenase